MIYEPREDSYLLERNLRKYVRGKKVLDMGAGSGIQSLSALKLEAKSVLSVDIDKESLEHLKKLNLNVVKSNLFSDVKGKFDLILFNPPYLPKEKLEDKESRRITTGGEFGDEIILKFLKKSKKHLTNKGAILLIISSLTPMERIIDAIKKLNYKHKVIDSFNLFMEKLELWELNVNS